MPARSLRPKWKLDAKGRLTIKELIREELGLNPGAWGYIELYSDGKILLIIMDKGVKKNVSKRQS